jgi:hypothetical protein
MDLSMATRREITKKYAADYAKSSKNAKGLILDGVRPLASCCMLCQRLGPDIKHKRTRRYRPQTNGQVERSNRTMLEEWAHILPCRSEAERIAAFPDSLHG